MEGLSRHDHRRAHPRQRSRGQCAQGKEAHQHPHPRQGRGGAPRPADPDDAGEGARLYRRRRAGRGDPQGRPAAQEAARSQRSEEGGAPQGGARGRVTVRGFVMAGFVPAIHVFLTPKDVDARDKPAHDGLYLCRHSPFRIPVAPRINASTRTTKRVLLLLCRRRYPKGLRCGPALHFFGRRVAVATSLRHAQVVSIFSGFLRSAGHAPRAKMHAVRVNINLPLNIALEDGRGACSYHDMSTILIEVRKAKPSDATAIASTHDEAWRCAYQGVIPGPELDKLINRRGPRWWDSAIRKGSRIAVLAFGDCIAGYANYGRNRARSLYYDGEIYELYLRPEFQGLGFGRKLFTAARRDLVQSGLQSLVVWALSDNEPAVGFYRALAGKAVARSSERFGARVLDKVAFGWNS